MTTEVLITGGAGFIGSALARTLDLRGAAVTVFDNLHPQVHKMRGWPTTLPPGVRVITGDVAHAPDWRTTLRLVQPAVVIHLAAETGTGQSLTQSSRHGTVNVVGTTNMLDAFLEHDAVPRHIVLASSRAVYGEGQWRSAGGDFYPPQRSHADLEAGRWDPTSPDGTPAVPVPSRGGASIPRPTSVYGATKLAQEHIISAWAGANGCALSVLRLQNVYGPGQSLTNPYTGIVSLFSRLAVEGKTIEVYEDGRVVRDFVYIDDVVDSLDAAVAQPPAEGTRVLDIGSGRTTTILELASTIAALTGAPEPTVSGQFRDGDVRAASCDVVPSRELLGLPASVELETGLLSLLQWVRPQLLRGGRHVTLGDGVQVALFAARSPENSVATVASLRAAHPDLRIVLGCPKPWGPGPASSADAHVVAPSLADLVNGLWAETGDHILAIGDTVVVPPGFLELGLASLRADMRVATVSFLSNAAAHLSFPVRNQPSIRGVDGADETSITRRLRTLLPGPSMAPTAYAAGAAVLISALAIGAAGNLRAFPSGSMSSTVKEFSLRARRRGFHDLLDAGTFITRPAPDIGIADSSGADAAAEDQSLMSRHPYFAEFAERELVSATSPVALALAAARAKVIGVRVVIEAHCIGPIEMGTQVQTLALIRALSASEDIAYIGVSLAAPPPAYALETLRLPKVDARVTKADDFSSFGHVDIVHRTYQPVGIDVGPWRATGSRVVVTIQDLIAYEVGAYHHTGSDWMSYRDTLYAAARSADGVIAISDDTRQQIRSECLPVEDSRVFVVPNGTDHLTGNESVDVPGELAARGLSAAEFILILGADYAHKNRDLGVRAWHELRGRGWRHLLVMAGAQVGDGSSRIQEVEAGAAHNDVVILPDVSSAERNWLLRHASLLLYPTSAEGFGLVPYEAARFGTATVAVPFGPLAEAAPTTTSWSSDWSPSAIAAVAEGLLLDPAQGREQVAETLRFGAQFTWEYTARRLIDAYRTLLGRPARA